MIVATIQVGECSCKVDDSAYKERSQEDVEHIVKAFSTFIAECLLEKKTA